jgi:NADPH2:quinone reductase
MKAIVVREFGGPEVLRLEELSDPRPGSGQVLIDVRAAGVNPFDTYMRAGTYGARNRVPPFTPGSDATGTIESLGSGVAGLKAGDRVFTSGTVTGAYAQLAVCASEQVHPLPANLGFAQGAGVYTPYATAYRALFQAAHAKPGETVLVHGASGGVGIACVQFAHAAGLTVIGTAGSDAGLAVAKEQGADLVANHHEAGYRDAILAMTNDRGVDVIVEMLANVNLAHDLKLLAPRGRAVVVGSRGDVKLTPRDLMAREASVMGVMLWNVTEPERREILAALHAGLSGGILRPIVAAELPLASAPEAHELIARGGISGKVVLLPSR